MVAKSGDLFGGLFDFNGDGKTDFYEEAVAYKLFEKINQDIEDRADEALRDDYADEEEAWEKQAFAAECRAGRSAETDFFPDGSPFAETVQNWNQLNDQVRQLQKKLMQLEDNPPDEEDDDALFEWEDKCDDLYDAIAELEDKIEDLEDRLDDMEELEDEMYDDLEDIDDLM